MFRRTAGLASAGVLAVTLGAAAVAPANAAQTAQASQSGSAAACALRLGSVTSTGAHTSRMINATAPITIGGVRGTAGVFPAGGVQLSSTFVGTPVGAEEGRAGLTVMGGALYSRSYVVDTQVQVDPKYPNNTLRVGGGWSNYRWIEQSVKPAATGSPARTLLYGQATNGLWNRWVNQGGAWRSTGGVGGFSTVKSMTLISRGATYETFLANTRMGMLETITWPTATNSVPKHALVRGDTWQNFEQLIATSCGANGTLLLAIDRDTKSGYLYAVGHANNAATTIRSLGKVPMTFSDPTYFRWAPKNDTLNGA
jgi:hypothetical protein